MKNLTLKQKNMLTIYGEAYLFYTREDVMLIGGESDEVVNRSNAARPLHSQMQVAIDVLCEMLDMQYSIDNLYSDSYVLNFWDKSGLNLVFSVDEKK